MTLHLQYRHFCTLTDILLTQHTRNFFRHHLQSKPTNAVGVLFILWMYSLIQSAQIVHEYLYGYLHFCSNDINVYDI